MRRVILLACICAGSLAATVSVEAGGIKSDETVYLFPTNGYVDQATNEWVVRIHGWIFEPELDSLLRRATLKSLEAVLASTYGDIDGPLLQRRLAPFLVDNERGKQIDVRIGRSIVRVGPSLPNGHFRGVFRLRRNQAGRAGWQSTAVVLPAGDRRRFGGQVQLLLPQGLSVISDVDDTVRDSNVLDKRELLANIFLRQFRAIPGMADAYRAWAAKGAAFHYVSAAPWQTAPTFRGFLSANGFPNGSVHMRDFRLQDASLLDMLQAPTGYKIDTIDAVMRTYPDRRFILVGDDGEHDPQVYCEILRRHPRQVIHVFIRRVRDGSESAGKSCATARLQHWSVFEDAEGLRTFDVPRPQPE